MLVCTEERVVAFSRVPDLRTAPLHERARNQNYSFHLFSNVIRSSLN